VKCDFFDTDVLEYERYVFVVLMMAGIEHDVRMFVNYISMMMIVVVMNIVVEVVEWTYVEKVVPEDLTFVGIVNKKKQHIGNSKRFAEIFVDSTKFANEVVEVVEVVVMEDFERELKFEEGVKVNKEKRTLKKPNKELVVLTVVCLKNMGQ
jgi:hypothetical protein